MVILNGLKFTLRDLVMRINCRKIAGVVRVCVSDRYIWLKT